IFFGFVWSVMLAAVRFVRADNTALPSPRATWLGRTKLLYYENRSVYQSAPNPKDNARMNTSLYHPQLAALLPALEGYVPVGMTLDRLAHFRALSAPSRDDLIGSHDVECIDYVVPGYAGAEILVSVISRKGHETPGPAVYFMHGG